VAEHGALMRAAWLREMFISDSQTGAMDNSRAYRAYDATGSGMANRKADLRDDPRVVSSAFASCVY